MELKELLQDVSVREKWGDLSVPVTGLHYDSRRVEPGTLFMALPGEKVDGNRFIPQALEKGACGVLSERAPETVRTDLGWIRVDDPRLAMGRMAANFYGHPSRDLKVAGITGTNGKTTTAFLLQHLHEAALRNCGLIGTVRYETGKRVIDASHTTPESVDVHALLAEMRENLCRAVIMEVSSHGLDQHRVSGVEFDVAVFTNLSQDHLDFHRTMERYFQSKRRLFQHLADQSGEKAPRMVVNGDDRFGQLLLREGFPGVEALSYGFGSRVDFQASNLRFEFDGATFQLETKGRQTLVRLPLIGRFNVYNALAALAAAKAMGLNLRESVRHLAEAPQVPGRMERVSGSRLPFHVFVDYAHTPDALEKACTTLRELEPARLITVFGCGGDRDKAKRPLMAKAAASCSDIVILTSDNPRTENPESILDDVEKGLSGFTHARVQDRREAIREAIGQAGPRDIVLIAGKGHETYQEIDGTRHDFDDRQEARFALQDQRDER